MRKILLTRPLKSSQKIAEILDQKNISYLIQPLFSVIKNKNLEPMNQSVQAVLITSHEAVFALTKLAIKKDILILAVGEKTSQKIKNLGYKNVYTASNSADSLLGLAEEKLDKNNGSVLYLSGEKITLDLADQLVNKGFKAQRLIVYKTIQNDFSDQTIDEISNKQISEVWIYSKNTLEIFYQLIQKHNLLKCFNQIEILCLSSKIADLAYKMKFSKIGIIKEYE